jgi:hypothetical protein
VPCAGTLTFTGEGKYNYGGNVNVQFINTNVRILGITQVLTAGDPKRIMHAGWIGLGYDGGVFPGGPPAMNWFDYLKFQSEGFIMSDRFNGNVNCDHLYYHLDPSVTLDVFTCWA